MKTLTCSLLIFGLALLASTANYAQAETDIETLRAADVNADGVINILDLVLIASHFGVAEAQTPNPDVNGDGSINVLDLVLVANRLGETVRPPVAFVSVVPEIGSELDMDGMITLTFDNPPEDVTLSAGVAMTDGNSVTITGPFTPGDLELTVAWGDGTETLSYTVRPPAAFVSAAPESGTVMTTNDSITLTFDNPPQDVTVSTGTATTDENTVTIEGPFTPGALELTVTWGDGTETLSYAVRPLAAFVSAAPENDVEITTEDSITLTFDNPPTDVTVSTGVAMTDGNSVKITGPFTPGALELTITWADGTETLAYTVRPIAVFTSADPESGEVVTTQDNITLTFDNPPEDVTVSAGTVTTDENTIIIEGLFTVGELELTITWADGTETLAYTVRPIAAFVSADPESGVEITTEDSITLTFDNPPEDVTVSEGTPTTDENTVTIEGPFTTGELELTITWADGTETLSYTVIELDTEAPSITGGTVSDGDTDVDASTTIEIEFSEDVRGLVTLRTEADDNVGWITTFDGNKVMLTPVAGKELAPETTYVIAVKVKDAADNETEINITFTTANAYDGIPIEVTDANFDTVVLKSNLPVVVESYKDG